MYNFLGEGGFDDLFLTIFFEEALSCTIVETTNNLYLSCFGGISSSLELVWALGQAPVDIEAGGSDVFWPMKKAQDLHWS